MDPVTNNNNQPASDAAPVQPAPVVPQAPVAPVEQKVADPTQAVAEVTADAIRDQLQQTLGQTDQTPQAPVAPQAPQPEQPAEPVAAPAPAPVEAPKVESATPVTIYTIETCPYCKAEKEYLDGKGIAYTEKRVDADEAALKEMLAVSDNFAGVPVTVLTTEKEKRVVKGFTQSDFEEELRSVGLLKEDAPVAPAAPQAAPATPPPAPTAMPAATPEQPAEAPAQPMPAVPDFPQNPQQ